MGERSEDELPLWYAASEGLVFPSLNEGFGLPALEAAACGTPVVASQGGAVSEILQSAIVPVDPRQVDSIADGMERLLREPGLRETLRSRGLERAAELRWETTAAKTLGVYERAGSR